MVSEKEIEAAAKEISHVCADSVVAEDVARAALEAAARARAEANAGEPVAGPDFSLQWQSKEAERRALYPHHAPQPSGTVEVKPLEWEEIHQRRSDEDPARELVGWEAETAFSDYYTVNITGGGAEMIDPSWHREYFDYPGAAKAAAQADYERRILSALTAGKPEQSAWRPIETAPKDGTQFQAWIGKYGWEPRARFNPDSEAFELWGRVDYDKDGWDVYSHMVPTHWLPLPMPPTAGGGDD